MGSSSILADMADALHRIFVDYSASKLRQMAGRIETCAEELTDEQFWARGSESENSAANLVLHLTGNVRQWIVSAIGGQPDIRQRDEEFAARAGNARTELTARLKTTVEEACDVIAHTTPERLAERITVQKYDVTVMEAIYHVVEHFSGHTGQIIFATKMLTGEDLGFHAHLRDAKAAHGKKTP
jgi:uncharacterized damage-inducible protein DinB